jgi:hypothetical protein
MPDAPKVEIVEFIAAPDARHVVEVEHNGARRRVVVRVDEGAWQGLGWFGSPHDGIERIVGRYVQLHAADGTLQDECFVSDDEAKDIHQGKK